MRGFWKLQSRSLAFKACLRGEAYSISSMTQGMHRRVCWCDIGWHDGSTLIFCSVVLEAPHALHLLQRFGTIIYVLSPWEQWPPNRFCRYCLPIFTRPKLPAPRRVAKDRRLLCRCQEITVRQCFVYVLPIADMTTAHGAILPFTFFVFRLETFTEWWHAAVISEVYASN